ncbi:CGNR zinc finger domain-containing protein [Nocardia transvalensis]|uniref:CGNR zinc finger domain-containing protein n=1 Tax=Nocardia transvalensis TaxID=37333 RepID=UPI00189525DE|nr:CGNR zinc finger domain-containing protein [Nocardia transvalensis]MBF6330254.1 CGNR zinc finger domain-containing protein [Nocardia transvalensis]
MTTWTSSNFIGGHPVLDFVNTAGGRTRARDVERLTRWRDALEWAVRAGVLDGTGAARLRGDAGTAEGERAIGDLRAQREALHAYLMAIVEDAEPPADARERVEADIRAAYAHARLSALPNRSAPWDIGVGTAGFGVLGGRIALLSNELLLGPERAQIRLCGACSWMYLDPSPSGRRRWCSMATCGNRAKARRHYDRARRV